MALSSMFLRTSVARPFSNSSLAVVESVFGPGKTACSPITLATSRSAVGEKPTFADAAVSGEEFISEMGRTAAAAGLAIGFPHPLQNKATSGLGAPQ
jgi:hypothetical protein